jgi:hypothetical protein
MNTKALARGYAALTARERLALVLSAEGRRDDVEAARLRASAPVALYRLPELTFAEIALHTLALIYVSEQLEHVASYWFARDRVDPADPDAEADWLLVAILSAYAYTVNRDAFGRLCAERGIAYDALIAANYHGWVLGVAEENMPAAAPTREEVTELLRGRGQTDSEPITADRALDGWRRLADSVRAGGGQS